MPHGARVLVAKVGLGGHDRGTGTTARILGDAGFEVIVSAPGLTPAMVVQECISLGADLVVLSMPSQSTTTLAPMVMKELRRHGLHVPVVVGGVVLPHDLSTLRYAGIAGTFGPAPTARHILEVVQRALTGPVLLAG